MSAHADSPAAIAVDKNFGSPDPEEWPVIPAGYYHSSDRHPSAVALHYLQDGQLEVLLDSGQRILAESWTGSCTFKLQLEKTKALKFTYHPETETLVKATKAVGGMHYARVGLWPATLSRSLYLPLDGVDACARDLRECGFAVLQGVFADRMPLLREVHDSFRSRADRHANTRGWYSGHEDYAEPPAMVRGLLEPLAPHLDRLLGNGLWEYDGRLQVGFATSEKVTPRLPNYHIDQMFLHKGEPFSVLVGVPLVGELDKPLGGALAVFEKSHTSIRPMLQAQDAAQLNGEMDKTWKLNTFCNVRSWRPTVIGALPGDVYFCHYRTIHGVTPNYLTDRSVAYMRIRVKKEVVASLQLNPLPRWTDSVLTYEPFVAFQLDPTSPLPESDLK